VERCVEDPLLLLLFLLLLWPRVSVVCASWAYWYMQSAGSTRRKEEWVSETDPCFDRECSGKDVRKKMSFRHRRFIYFFDTLPLGLQESYWCLRARKEEEKNKVKHDSWGWKRWVQLLLQGLFFV